VQTRREEREEPVEERREEESSFGTKWRGEPRRAQLCQSAITIPTQIAFAIFAAAAAAAAAATASKNKLPGSQRNLVHFHRSQNFFAES